MGYVISYRRYPWRSVEYHRESEYHLAWTAADGVLVQGWKLLDILSTPDAHPLTRDQVLARRDAKAMYCKDYRKNIYEDEERYCRALLRRGAI